MARVNLGRFSVPVEVALPDATATEVMPENSERAERAFMFNDSGETLYVGVDNSVDDTDGIPWNTSTAFLWPDKSSAFVYNASGGPLAVRRMR
jgi:hypothetical protein